MLSSKEWNIQINYCSHDMSENLKMDKAVLSLKNIEKCNEIDRQTAKNTILWKILTGTIAISARTSAKNRVLPHEQKG